MKRLNVEVKETMAPFVEFAAGEKIRVKARKLAYDDGSYALEVSVKADGAWTRPIEMRLSNLHADVKKLMDRGVSLDAIDQAQIVKRLKSEFGSLPEKKAQVRLGFNVDGDDIQFFQAGCVISADGKFYGNDARDGIPELKGNVDVNFLQKYATKVKRQLVLLHSLMAPLVALCIMQGDNMATPLLLLVGESSTGKTTIARLAESLAISPRFRRTNLDFNSTDNSLLYAIGDVWGVPLLIDDTSLGEAREYRKLLYELSSGYDKARLTVLRKRMVQAERREHGTTVILTSERDIMLGISADYLGAAARMFPLEVTGTDLFDTSCMVREAEQWMEENQGTILPYIVKWMMEQGMEAVIRQIRDEQRVIADRLDGEDNIIQRWGRYFAIQKVTAKALKSVTGLDFDSDEVMEFMVGILKERLLEQRGECTDALVREELYDMLLTSAEKERACVNGECIRYVQSKTYKAVIEKFICNNHLNYTYREISHKLCDMELIKRASRERLDKNVYGLGKCYLLRVKENKVIEAAADWLDENEAA